MVSGPITAFAGDLSTPRLDAATGAIRENTVDRQQSLVMSPLTIAPVLTSVPIFPVAGRGHIQPRRRYMAIPSHSYKAASESTRFLALGSHFSIR